MNRRSFAGSVAAAVLAPVLGVPEETLRGDLRRLGRSVPLTLPPTVAGDTAAAGQDGAAALALALVEILRLEYGHALTPAELGAITLEIRTGLDRADLIRRAEGGRKL